MKAGNLEDLEDSPQLNHVFLLWVLQPGVAKGRSGHMNSCLPVQKATSGIERWAWGKTCQVAVAVANTRKMLRAAMVCCNFRKALPCKQLRLHSGPSAASKGALNSHP